MKTLNISITYKEPDMDKLYIRDDGNWGHEGLKNSWMRNGNPKEREWEWENGYKREEMYRQILQALNPSLTQLQLQLIIGGF